MEAWHDVMLFVRDVGFVWVVHTNTVVASWQWICSTRISVSFGSKTLVKWQCTTSQSDMSVVNNQLNISLKFNFQVMFTTHFNFRPTLGPTLISIFSQNRQVSSFHRQVPLLQWQPSKKLHHSSHILGQSCSWNVRSPILLTSIGVSQVWRPYLTLKMKSPSSISSTQPPACKSPWFTSTTLSGFVSCSSGRHFRTTFTAIKVLGQVWTSATIWTDSDAASAFGFSVTSRTSLHSLSVRANFFWLMGLALALMARPKCRQIATPIDKKKASGEIWIWVFLEGSHMIQCQHVRSNNCPRSLNK